MVAERAASTSEAGRALAEARWAPRRHGRAVDHALDVLAARAASFEPGQAARLRELAETTAGAAGHTTEE